MKRNRDRGRIEQGVLQMNYIIQSNIYIVVSNKEKATMGYTVCRASQELTVK